MNGEEDFLQAIQANPEDDALRSSTRIGSKNEAIVERTFSASTRISGC